MENSKFTNPSLKDLEIMYSKSIDTEPSNLKSGLTNRKNNRQANKERIYRSSFKIKSFIEENISTNMVIPAIIEAVGNNFIKIGIGISAVISAIGYLIERIKN